MSANKPDTSPGFSFLRHLSSLSAGGIVLQIGFIEKVFPHPQWKAWIAVSIISFTASIVFSVVSQWSMLGIMNVGPTEGFMNVGGFAVVLMWITFVFGLIVAVAVSLKNLFQL